MELMCENSHVRTDVFEWTAPKPRRIDQRWSEDVVLEAALAPYRDCLGCEYQIITRPDKQNRTSREVDAIAAAAGAPPLAFEHTRLETFTGQLEDDQKVQALLGSFQQELANVLPQGLSCTIPVHAFVKGTDWRSIRGHIAAYLHQIANECRPGTEVAELDGVPFPVWITYEPDLSVPFRFWRMAPPRSSTSRDMLLSMEKALSHKRERLREYANDGYRSVLIVDSGDMSLTSWVEPYKAFLVAEQTIGSDHVSDVLFAWTDDPHRIYFFGFKGDPFLLDELNPPNLKLGRHRLAAWEATLND
jgi:hypothetical protein